MIINQLDDHDNDISPFPLFPGDDDVDNDNDGNNDDDNGDDDDDDGGGNDVGPLFLPVFQ